MTLLILKSLRKNGINRVLMTLTQAKSSLEKTCPLLGSLTLGHKTGNVVYIEIVFSLLHRSLPILKKFKKKRMEDSSTCKCLSKKKMMIYIYKYMFLL